jgi:hypothetical protein
LGKHHHVEEQQGGERPTTCTTAKNWPRSAGHIRILNQSTFLDLARSRIAHPGSLETRRAAIERGSRNCVKHALGRIDGLVIDDWAMVPLNENERREVWEICEDRYQTRSTILTSQLPVSRWHEQIGDPTIADGILDRLVHNSHRIEMRGEYMRKNAIRHRTTRRNEPKPVSVRCLSYGNNFPEPDSGQLPEPASGVDRCSTADESHAEPHAPITASLLVIRQEPRNRAYSL